MGIAFELDAERFSHGRTAAVAADQISAGDLPRAFRGLDFDLDAVAALGERCHPGRELDLGVGKFLQPLDRHAGQLVLLALHREWIGRLVLEYPEIEFGDDLLARAVPDAKQRLDQTALDDLVHHAEPGQHFQRRRVGGRRARHVVDFGLGLEHVDRQPLARKRQSA